MKQLTIIGNLGYDANLKESNGNRFLAFSVAVNERYKNSEGQRVESVDWISVTTRQTNLSPYLKKGTKVFIQGTMKINVFKSRDGFYKAGINLHASNIQLLSSRRDESAESAEPAGEAYANSTDPVPEGDDDLPF